MHHYDALEVFYHAHRAIIAKPDELLSERGLSRVHHRILFFVARNPGVSVNELLTLLRVSKQYLSLPMRTLANLSLITHSTDARDRRIKRISLTDTGADLEHMLTHEQSLRMAQAFGEQDNELKLVWMNIMQRLAGLS